MGMEQEVREVREMLARVDERTVAILSEQRALNERFDTHEAEDREDFKEVHHRISRTERKVNWILGLGAGIAFLVSAIGAYLKLAGLAVAALIGFGA